MAKPLLLTWAHVVADAVDQVIQLQHSHPVCHKSNVSGGIPQALAVVDVLLNLLDTYRLVCSDCQRGEVWIFSPGLKHSVCVFER